MQLPSATCCGVEKALHSSQPAGSIWSCKQLDRVRLSKVKIRTILQNQILGHLDRIFPSLVIIGDQAKERYTPLFATDFWECKTLQHLIRVCPDPRTLVAMSPQDLVNAFHARHYPLGRIRATKIIAYAKKVLLPNAELIAVRCELLHHDLALLEEVEHHIVQLEDRLRTLLAETLYQVLTLFLVQNYTAVNNTGFASCASRTGHAVSECRWGQGPFGRWRMS